MKNKMFSPVRPTIYKEGSNYSLLEGRSYNEKVIKSSLGPSVFIQAWDWQVSKDNLATLPQTTISRWSRSYVMLDCFLMFLLGIMNLYVYQYTLKKLTIYFFSINLRLDGDLHTLCGGQNIVLLRKEL